jgi:DNA-binding IclR family transcriptional regulator
MRNEQPYLIDSVDNALSLLLLVRERGRVRVAEAAEHLGVARSTAYRLLAGLRHRGFVAQDSHRVYRPGPVFGQTGLTAVAPDLRLLARPHLTELGAEVDETVHLMALEGNGVRFLDGIETSRSLRVGSRIGLVLPAHCTSGGLVLLAELPAEELGALYFRGLPSSRGDAITTLPELKRRLAVTRRNGYAVNQGESERGITAVGVCVRDETGNALAALAVAMPSARCSRPQLPKYAAILHEYADRLRSDLTS